MFGFALESTGDLQEIMSLDISTHAALVARIKIMGKMDIAEKRVPPKMVGWY